MGDVIGVMLDMVEVSVNNPITLTELFSLQGTLSFSKNGRSWGVAFSSTDLCTGELYPAVAPIY